MYCIDPGIITLFILTSSLFLFFCTEIEENLTFEISEINNCDFIAEKVHYFDFFEGFMTITLNHAYLPDIDKRDSLMNDYHYLKFQNEKINGTYIITDANVRYKVNRVEPYDSISYIEYPFSINQYV